MADDNFDRVGLDRGGAGFLRHGVQPVQGVVGIVVGSVVDAVGQAAQHSLAFVCVGQGRAAAAIIIYVLYSFKIVIGIGYRSAVAIAHLAQLAVFAAVGIGGKALVAHLHSGHVPEAVIDHGIGLGLFSAHVRDIPAARHGAEPAGAVSVSQGSGARNGRACNAAVGGVVGRTGRNIIGVLYRRGLAGHLADVVAVGVGDGVPPGVGLGSYSVPRAVIGGGGGDLQICACPRQRGARGVARL